MNLWCLLGHHKWKKNPRYEFITERERTCQRCGRHEHSHFNWRTSGTQWDFVEYHNIHLITNKEENNDG